MSSFQVTTPNARLRNLQPGETLSVPYTVANVSGGARRASYEVKTTDDGTAGWYSVSGDQAGDYAAGATQQVTVLVTPPKTAIPKTGGYAFHLFVGLAGQTSVDFTDGPDVSYDVAEKKPQTNWWPYVIAAVVLLAIVVGIVLHFMQPSKVASITVPSDLSGKTLGNAKAELSGIGVPIAHIAEVCTTGGFLMDSLPVLNSVPQAGQALASGATLTLIVSGCSPFLLSPAYRHVPLYKHF